ncbi:hypothetical protein [Cupriavidus taiwanensis]|uniref:Uncharacterized protein n=1 Tax=Cupriavidus taiwanensis TaxID=164546 RepID=A0A375J5W7_9BURK|nr:hypothetical protein [Cupriavidus taiwanensis]SPS00062.1 conserved exported hypothetical protein [Cupriavidus taiwanensis]
MKYVVAWICAALATLLAATVVYLFGITPLTLLIGLFLLSCPVAVLWISLRLSRQCERDIRNAVKHELEEKRRTEGS